MVKKKASGNDRFHFILSTAYAIDNIYARGDKMVVESIMWDGRHSIGITLTESYELYESHGYVLHVLNGGNMGDRPPLNISLCTFFFGEQQ